MVVRANKKSAGSAATSPPSPPRPRSTKSASTTSSRPGRPARRRLDLLPGPRLARHVRARLRRRPAHRRAARELPPGTRGGGLSSYPHPWLMPNFWQFPTVSMGLGPIMAIYQARFNRYLRAPRPQADTDAASVWCFLGDGETRRAGNPRRHHPGLAREARQPDLRHQLQPAAPRRPGPRQRQDHPGAGSRLPRRRLERHQGHLGQRLGPAARAPTRPACSSSAWAKSSTANIRNTSSSDGAYIREHFFGKYPELLELVEHLSDEQLRTAASAAATIRKRSTPPTRRPSITRAADGHPGQDDQGLRAGRGRRGPQHHPPAEEARRGRAARTSAAASAFRISDERRRRRSASTSPPTTARK